MRTEYCGICDIGKRREKNQDAIFMDAGSDAALFAVADGMGGYLHGEDASRIIVGEMRKWWEEFPALQQTCGAAGDFGGMISALRQRLELANRIIYERYGSGRDICGSTVAVLFLYRESYCVLSSGDSRIYYLNGFAWKQLTSDDVWENQPQTLERYSPAQIRAHRDHGKLVHAIGVAPEASISGKTDILKGRDCFLICSDGLYKMCRERDIRRAMKEYRHGRCEKEPLQGLLRTVYENSASDNVSAILVRVEKNRSGRKELWEKNLE